VLESSLTTISIRLFGLSNSPTNPIINYNGQDYIMTITDEGNNTYLLSKNVTVPLGSETTNPQFYFKWNSEQSDTYTHSVGLVLIGLCSAELPYNLVTFYTRDAKYPRDLIDTTLVLTIKPTYCYQEHPNAISACGGLGTGSYSSTANYNEVGHLTMNYTKPENTKFSDPGIYGDHKWYVKHGNLDAYNITLPETCWDYNEDYLMLRFESSAAGTIGNESYSQPQCMNETGDWMDIGNRSNVTATFAAGTGSNYVARLTDGNWATGAAKRYVSNYWTTYTNEHNVSMVFEEAMFWSMEPWVGSEYEFCTDEDNRTFYGNMAVIVSKDGWDQLTNYYSDVNLTTEIPKEYKLYLTEEGTTTPTVIELIDTSGLPQEGVTVVLQTYYPDLDAFIETGAGVTSVLGDKVFRLNWYDTIYRFIFSENGSVVLATGSFEISKTPTRFMLPYSVENIYDNFDGVEFDLTFDNETNQFTVTWVDTLARITSGCLLITKSGTIRTETISKQCLASHSATLYYVVNESDTGTGTYIGTFYATYNPTNILGQVFETIGEARGELEQAFNKTLGEGGAVWMSIIIVGTVAFSALFSPVLAIIATIVGLVIAWGIGMLTIQLFGIVSITLVAGILIWAIRK